MNSVQPPAIPKAPTQKSGLPTWAIVLIVVGGVGFVGVAMIGLLAAIAIPNFVKARNTAQMIHCIDNLRQIDSAKQQWALEHTKAETDTPTQSDITVYLKNGQWPICLAGGSYSINAVNKEPACSIPGHQLPDLPAWPER
jgi:type II secretory pathway pseudopilin PulG